MSLFDNMLKDNESLFKNELALDFSFQPKILKYREKEQRYIAEAIKPLFANRNGKNLFIYGRPGIGKTLAAKHVLDELEENYDEIEPIYINCWQKNTTYKIAVAMCEILGYKFTQNKKTEELIAVIKNIINKKSAVFCFDEIDKLEDFDFIYTIIEQIYRKTIILITNYKEWLEQLDDRIKSRLLPDMIEFRVYNREETRGILEQRKELGFVANVWDNDAFNMVVEKTFELKDIRTGLHIMKEAALAAESESSRKITTEHVKKAFEKLSFLSIKKTEELDDDLAKIVDIVKVNSGKRIGELYKIALEKGEKFSYKTFQRKIKKLADNKFVSLKKISGGPEGSTTIVYYLQTKKLTEF